jgi:PPK2 family polyphosphate:nucleotide phosphotransferase
MKKIDIAECRVGDGEKVDLSKRPTKTKRLYQSKDDYHAALADHVRRMDELERVHWAANTHALLVIFQGMDAAGKDSAIRHVMSGVDPRGCNVFGFQHPTPSELEHDFLWRASVNLPERGRIAIFNPSYYEEVLIVRVHPEILDAQDIPRHPDDPERVWKERYRSIVDFERHLHHNGTRIVKIFLHLSKGEQRRRFVDRIDDPTKSWKFTRSDLLERGFWKDYRTAYEKCLSATSTRRAPWYVVPADDKSNARLIVSAIVLDAFARLKPRYPPLTPARRRELARYRRLLVRKPRRRRS